MLNSSSYFLLTGAIILAAPAFSRPVTSEQRLAQSFVLPLKAPEPKDNIGNAHKVELGKQLFFDPRISMDGTVSCNSCHNVMSSGTDNRAVSAGVAGKLGGRSAPTVFNAAFYSALMWDGRKTSLEDQATGPLTNPVEMAMPSNDAVIERLKQIDGYSEGFTKAFGGKNALNIENFTKAIAAYERTLITPNSPFDQWARGDSHAISASAQRGFAKMNEIGCTSCHSGPGFSGPPLPVGTPFLQRFPTFADNEYVKKYDLQGDDGRKKVTKEESDAHMFRVPTLRNVATTAPYFHNGKVLTLHEAIRVMAKTQLNKNLAANEVEDIYNFLVTLTGSIPEQKMPRLSRTLGTSVTPQ
jgi:cytochrome c peroxidase